MLTLLTAATLLATTPAEAPAPRFADTHAAEAHREVLQASRVAAASCSASTTGPAAA